MKIEKPQFRAAKAQPFGAHFTAKLDDVNNKLVCALSSATTCTDDQIVTEPWVPAGPDVQIPP